MIATMAIAATAHGSTGGACAGVPACAGDSATPPPNCAAAAADAGAPHLWQNLAPGVSGAPQLAHAAPVSGAPQLEQNFPLEEA